MKNKEDMHFNTCDLTGQTFKFWKVIQYDPERRWNGQTCWICECVKCKKTKNVSYFHIKAAATSSCECKNDLVGQKFNSLTIIGKPFSRQTSKNKNTTYVLCKCDCGKEKECRLTSVRKGNVKSCGCWCYEKDENGHSLIKKKKLISSEGYVLLYVPDHPNANDRGRVLEHRVVMEKYLGRLLTENETVHHRNGQKDQNNIENLELWANNHQKGQRIEDLVSYAKEILEKYDNYKNPTKLYFTYQLTSPVTTFSTHSENLNNTITLTSKF